MGSRAKARLWKAHGQQVEHAVGPEENTSGCAISHMNLRIGERAVGRLSIHMYIYI